MNTELYLHYLNVFMAWYLVKDRDNLIHILSPQTRDRSQDSPVGVAMGYTMDVLGTDPDGGKEIVLFSTVSRSAMVTK
jgi:hypothetical protein